MLPGQFQPKSVHCTIRSTLYNLGQPSQNSPSSADVQPSPPLWFKLTLYYTRMNYLFPGSRTRLPDLNRYKAALQLAIDTVSRLARTFRPAIILTCISRYSLPLFLVLVPGPEHPSTIYQLPNVRFRSLGQQVPAFSLSFSNLRLRYLNEFGPIRIDIQPMTCSS